MTERCGTVRSHLEAWAGGTLDEGLRRRVEDHLASCPGCREEAADLDPAAIFLALREEPLPDGIWTGFEKRLLARIGDARPAFDWRSLLRPPRLISVTAPIAILLAIAAAFLMTRPGMFGPRGPEVVRQGQPQPQVVRGEWRVAAGTAGERPVPPLLEEVRSPGARVYRFSVGEAGEETPVYFVVDESINI